MNLLRLHWLQFALLLFVTPGTSADLLEGRVIRIADGDTLTVLVEGQQRVKVHLADIDPPKRARSFGRRSRQMSEPGRRPQRWVTVGLARAPVW